MQKPGKVRTPRSYDSLVKRLQFDCDLLKEYAIKTFAGGEPRHGEIAGKLRVLISREGRNTPLLISLMELFEFNPKLPIPLSNGSAVLMTLPEFLGQTIFTMVTAEKKGLFQYWCASFTPGCTPVKSGASETHINYAQFATYLAQQDGAAHVDWELSGDLEFLLSGRPPIPEDATPRQRELFSSIGSVRIAGMQHHEIYLRTMTGVVLHASELFLRWITPSAICAKEEERRQKQASDDT